MKKLLILSGKGGTGKTTLASAFIRLSQAKSYADCDVDAPNLHLVTSWPDPPQSRNFYGLPVARIDPDLCINCGLCKEHCRFRAIHVDGVHVVDPMACEGCSVCEFVCPVDAVAMEKIPSGQLMLYKDPDRVFSTAELRMGAGTSGLLVAEVKKQLRQEAVHGDFAIIDGSPGIGCPVIASLSGVDMVLVVAEPSLSGISDMERVIDTAMKFGVRIGVVINKHDTNPEKTKAIQSFCQEEKIPLVGLIPFDPMAVEAINQGLTIVDMDCPSGKAVQGIFDRTMNLLFMDKEGDQPC